MNRRVTTGSALLGSLAFVLIVSLMLVAVGAVALSYHNRAVYEADNAHAIQLADAGVNYQLRKISENITDPNGPCQADAPCSGSVPGVPGTFSVYIRNEDGSSPWSAPNAGVLCSVGTVNGFARAVEIRGTKKSIFDEYAIFSIYYGPGVETLTFDGTNSVINGNVGSNGRVDSDSGEQINGELTLHGQYAANSDSGSNVFNDPNVIVWPTVDQIANAQFPAGGLAWLKTHNNNGSLLQYTKDGSSYESAGYKSSSLDLETNDFNKLNYAPSGSLAYGYRTMVFPPGDYYFENVNVSGDHAVLIDNRNGPVRIWITGNGNADTLNANFYYLDSTPAKFRLYYNKCNTLSLGGNTTFYGGFYAWRTGCPTNKLPSLKFTGGSDIYGAAIAGTLTISGGSVVNFPNDGGNSAVDDFSLWYGFKDSWREVAIQAGAVVFPDGTSH